MRKLTAIFMALVFAFTSTLALAGKQSNEEKMPETIGIIVKMPDGSLKLIQLPVATEEILDKAETDEVNATVAVAVPGKFEIEKDIIIYIPPIFFWQPGWFYYSSVLFLGYRGPNGIYWLYASEQWYFWDGDSWVPTDFLT